jgi:transcriptional regulator with XRE-family HTH domain
MPIFGTREATMLQQRFAENLKSTRLRRRLSQTALAEKAAVSVSYISMLERAQRSPPLETIEVLASALGVKPTALLAA